VILNLSISEEMMRFVEAKVASGRYASADLVIEHALRLLEEIQKPDMEKRASLKAAYEEGLASGDAGDIDIEQLIEEARRQHRADE
jgi:antitoxin ParD1/3/4